MTLTLELSPALEARLKALARTRGVDPVEIATELLADHLPVAPAEPLQNGTTATLERDLDRVARVQSIRGKYAHLGVRVEDLHRERQAEKEREEGATHEDTP